MKHLLANLNKKGAVYFTLVGVIIGVLGFVGVRATLIEDNHTHYHANFGVFINGERDKFDNFTFYEEVQSCSADEHNNPKHRAHMHENVSHVVHVHDDTVTWGAFFANLGYGLANNLVKTDDGVFVDGKDGKKLTFFLNRQPVQAIANRVIQSEDELLVDYGDGTKIDQNYNQIEKDAGEYNKKQDPASCAGSEKLTLGERLKRAVDFTQ